MRQILKRGWQLLLGGPRFRSRLATKPSRTIYPRLPHFICVYHIPDLAYVVPKPELEFPASQQSRELFGRVAFVVGHGCRES